MHRVVLQIFSCGAEYARVFINPRGSMWAMVPPVQTKKLKDYLAFKTSL